MEKTFWFFRRIHSRDRENFANHYIDNHAPLGKALCRSLRGYTVNIVHSSYPNAPDAIAEHWLEQASDLFDREKNFATPEDKQRVSEDDRSLFDGIANPYIVDRQFSTLPGDLISGPLESPSPGVKLFWTYGNTDDVPSPPVGANRVIDSYVAYARDFRGGTGSIIEPDIAVIRMAWADALESVGSAVDDAIVTTEYRFIDPAEWEL